MCVEGLAADKVSAGARHVQAQEEGQQVYRSAPALWWRCQCRACVEDPAAAQVGVKHVRLWGHLALQE